MALLERQWATTSDLEALMELPENDERHFELIDGEIVEMSPRLRHGFAASILHGEIYAWLKDNPLGEVMFEVEHRVPGDEQNSRHPDVSFVTHERLKDLDPDQPIPFMPDLAIEVKSPGNYIKGLRGLREKALYYLENGSRLVWLLFPDSETGEVVHRSIDGAIQFLPVGKDGVFEGGDVLPGFTLNLKTIFKKRK